MRARRPVPLVRAAAAFAVVAAVVAAGWLRLELDQTPILDVLEAIGIAAIVPVAVLLARRRSGRRLVVAAVAVAAFALAVLLAAAAAFHVPVTEMRPGEEHDYFGPVVESARAGFRDFYSTAVPFDRIGHPEMESLALFAIFAFAALAGLALALGAPVWASLLLLVGAGWPATLLATIGGNGLAAGAVILSAILIVLLLVRADRRPARVAAQAGLLASALALAAVGASTSTALAKDAILPWEDYSPYGLVREQVGVRYVWSTTYGGLRWPDRPTVVLEVQAPARGFYWRATTLDEHTGIGWREALSPGAPLPISELGPETADPLLPDQALETPEAQLVKQVVTVEALFDEHLIAAPSPVRWELPDAPTVQLAGNGVVFLPGGLQPAQTYTVWSYAPDVRPENLVDLEPDYGLALERYLELVPGVAAPAFGTERRQRAMAELFDGSTDPVLAPLRPLYEQAVEVVGDAPTPYLAAVGLEGWFRTSGGFTYEEQPAAPSGDVPPLVGFVLETKSGYCQHYAGAMALMLRMLGIPARVAAGFVSGSYDQATGVWRVQDRDAHTWVEVWFPRHGWLAFDPTPGRGGLSAAYSVSSDSFTLETAAATTAGAALLLNSEDLAAIFGPDYQRLRELNPDIGDAGSLADEPRRTGITTGSSADGDGRDIPTWLWAVIGAACAALAFLGLKALRRRVRLAASDPRRVATACRRDLVGYLADQGVDVSESTTLTELGERVATRYGVDTTYFVRAASEARFGGPERAPEAARIARRELRTLERGIRRELTPTARARGAFRARSLLR